MRRSPATRSFDARARTAPGAARQTSLRRSVSLSGVGAHGGVPALVTLSPAAAGTGIVFCLADGTSLPALWRHVDPCPLQTRLRHGAASVATVEHVLAALAGLGVDNALIEIDGPELPAGDGSARLYVEAIQEAGIAPLAAPRRVLRVAKTLRVADGAGWAEISPDPSGLSLDVEIAFVGAAIGRQRRALRLASDVFRAELAPARSFGFLADAERLWRAGLALGASLDNTLVLDGDRLLNPQGLRFPDEFVRHKMLDALGDLTLAGAPLIGAFRSYRGGHALNRALVDKLMTTPGAAIFEEPRLSAQVPRLDRNGHSSASAS